MRSFFGWTKVTNGTINDNVTGGTVGGAMAMSSSKDALCLMKVVLQVQVDGMVQSISTHSVKALKILVRQLKYMLIKVKRCYTCNTVCI